MATESTAPKATTPPTLREADLEAMGFAERQRRRDEIAAAVAARTIVPKRYRSRENDRGWTLAALEAEENGPPPEPRRIVHEPDLERLPLAERQAIHERAARGEVDVVSALDGRRTFHERVAAVKADHERATAEWRRLTGAATSKPKTAGIEGLSTSELAALLEAEHA